MTEQIAELVERKKGINEGRAQIAASMATYQERLDKAEETLVDCITTEMAESTPQNVEAVSEARVARNVITNQYQQHQHDLKLLPEAVKKLDRRINELTAQKVLAEREIIASKITDIDKLQDAARIAIAELSAAVCLTSTRHTHYVGVKEVCKQLDKDTSVSRLYIQKYNDLEASMGFDQI